MSKLLELYEGTQYTRLTSFAAGGNELNNSFNYSNGNTFSVRAQGNPTTETERQNNAVNFFDNSGLAGEFAISYAKGFNVNKASNALSTVGYKKADTADASDFVGNPDEAGTGNAKSGLTHYTKLVLNANIFGSQVYDAVREDKTYTKSTGMSAAKGVTLLYGSVPALPSAPTRN